MPDVRPLEPLVGNLWVPAWLSRPGSCSAVKPVAREMPLWLLLHSRNGHYWHACYHTREQLGATLVMSVATVSRQLARLREHWFVFEVQRGVERKTRRHRPPARWALDPFKVDLWRPKVEADLARIAEEDGHDGRWYQRAVTSLEAFERRSRILGAKIGADMPQLLLRRQRKKRRRVKKSHDSK